MARVFAEDAVNSGINTKSNFGVPESPEVGVLLPPEPPALPAAARSTTT